MAKRYKKNNTIKTIILIFTIIILIALLIFSGIKILQWVVNNNENNQIQERLSNYAKENTEENDKQNNEENNGNNKYNIDFESLKKINEDTCAWLKVNNTNIEYVVVKANNNEYYINHNFEKKENVAGWIFADYRNKFNSEDRNIIIYGHNMKNKSMFGSLSDTLKKDWCKQEENKFITLVTPEGSKKYEVFSIYEERASDYPITTEFSSDSEYITFLKTIKSKSIYNFNVDISDTKGILTLSTCGNNNVNRVTLHAKLLEEH